MKSLALAALLLSSVAALAASPEDAYLAARDRDIASLKTMENANDAAADDAQFEKDAKDLELLMKAIVGPVAVAGFPAAGKINLDSLFPHDEGFGMLDGLVYGGGDKSVIVTTDGLLDKWLLGHRHWWSKDNLPTSAAAAVKTEAFYTQAVSTDAAVVHYADLPVDAPPGAKFAHATLSARTQDGSPNAPDEIFVALERGGRVFVVNEKLHTPMQPIAACDAVTAAYAKTAATANKAYADSHHKTMRLADRSNKLRDEGDAAFRACFGDKVKGTPAFKAATDQAAAAVAAFAR